ncbi:signal peptidase I [Niameybacter sp.]|uniref:signal peptidase I n=1 Tax=Niameybacter sp. TaxID=2033640 RepID=UPI002FC63287
MNKKQEDEQMETMQNGYKKISIGLIAVLLGLYIMKYTDLLSFIDNTLLSYWIIPGIWCVVIVLYYTRMPRTHTLGKLKFRGTVYAWAFNCGALFIGVNLLAGFIQEFGKSPYSHSLKAIGMNMLVVGSALVGRECIRSYLVNVFYKKKQVYFWLIIGVMTVTHMNGFQNTDLKDIESLTIFLAQQVGPEVFENILATYLVLYGGPLASIIYLGMIEGFEWLSPILPNLDWLAKCLIGISIPLISSAFISNSYMKLAKYTKSYGDQGESLWNWLPTATICILWIWFTVGVFPIYPSVVATGSMIPMIDPGDVILVDKITTVEEIDQLAVGDVIQFKREDILISHRVIDIVEEEGQRRYRTKGDNNSSEDSELVKMEDVKGTIIHVIPKIGWPTLIFKSDNPDILDEVEF